MGQGGLYGRRPSASNVMQVWSMGTNGLFLRSSGEPSLGCFGFDQGKQIEKRKEDMSRQALMYKITNEVGDLLSKHKKS